MPNEKTARFLSALHVLARRAGACVAAASLLLAAFAASAAVTLTSVSQANLKLSPDLAHALTGSTSGLTWA